MMIEFNKHSFEITPALKQYTTEKFGRLSRHFDHIIRIIVTLDKERNDHIAKATIHVAKKDLHASSTSIDDMYSAIDLLVDKLDRLLIQHKELLKDHHPEQ